MAGDWAPEHLRRGGNPPRVADAARREELSSLGLLKTNATGQARTRGEGVSLGHVSDRGREASAQTAAQQALPKLSTSSPRFLAHGGAA